MNLDDRQKLREAATRAARARLEPSMDPGPWELQTSNSFRRIGMSRGDGNVLCAVKHPIDGHPDLLAPPGVLDYIIAAQPAVVLALLDDLAALEEKLRVALVISDKIHHVEKRLDMMAEAFIGVGGAMTQLLDSPDPNDVIKVRALFEQLVVALREARQ